MAKCRCRFWCGTPTTAGPSSDTHLHVARVGTEVNTRLMVALATSASEIVSVLMDTGIMLILSPFLWIQDLGRLEQCSRETRALASEGWSSKVREKKLRVEAREGAKRAVERFVCLGRFASRCRQLADSHYLRSDGQYLMADLERDGRGGLIPYLNPCNDEHCNFPRTLEVGECFERPDDFHFFLLLSHGNMVLHDGYVKCRRAPQSLSPDNLLWNTVRATLYLDLEGTKTNGDIFDSLNPNLEALKPLRVVLLCSRKMSPVVPSLVVATAIGDDWNTAEHDDDVFRWLLRDMPVITHGGVYGGTRRLGSVEGEFHILNTNVHGIQIAHDIADVQYDHVNYPHFFHG